MNEQPAQALPCEHHWVAHFQPDLPKILGWVSVCSLCSAINGAELCARLGEPRDPTSMEVLAAVAYQTALGRG